MDISGYKVPVWQTPGEGLATKGDSNEFRYLRRPDGSNHLVGSIVPDGTPLTPLNSLAQSQLTELFAD